MDQSRSESPEEVKGAIGINCHLWDFSSLPGTMDQRMELPLGAPGQSQAILASY